MIPVAISLKNSPKKKEFLRRKIFFFETHQENVRSWSDEQEKDIEKQL